MLAACTNSVQDEPQTQVEDLETQATNDLYRRVWDSESDAEESESGVMALSSADLEMVDDDGRGKQRVGVRFPRIDVPRGATITKAWIQFTVDEPTSMDTTVGIRAIDQDDAPTFNTATTISGRAKTSAGVTWSIPPWEKAGDSGIAQRTPDLKAIVQEIIERPGWQRDNDISFVVSYGGGKRVAHSRDAGEDIAPLLYVQFASIPKPEAAYLTILSEREGFGRNATGGEAGPITTVTNLNNRGEGSLREAVSLPGPRWIVFEPGLSGSIQLASALEVEGDKTIDGRGADITISGQTLELYSDNVIVTHLKFRGSSNDAIRVGRGSRDLWIHRNSLSRAGDGLIDVIEGSSDVTISWNIFSDHGKTLLLGRDQEQAAEVTTVSLHHNVFQATEERNPKMNRGKVHSYNNYLVNWRYVGAYAEAGGEIYSEANIYEAGDKKRTSNYETENPGYLRSVNDLMQNGAFHRAINPENVFVPSSFYAYNVDKADEALKATLLRDAGWQSTAFPGR